MLYSSGLELEAVLSPRGHLAMSGDLFDSRNKGGEGRGITGIYWTEARDGVKQPTIRRTAPATENCPAPDVGVAEAEKPCLRVSGGFVRWIERVKMRTYILARWWVRRCQKSRVCFYSFFICECNTQKNTIPLFQVHFFSTKTDSLTHS